MIDRKAAIAMALLCGIAVCAFLAQSALALPGTIALTCAPEPLKEGSFNDEHCASENSDFEGTYQHVLIAQDKAIDIHITNEKTSNDTKAATPLILKGKLGKEEAEVVCKKVFGHAKLTNTYGMINEEFRSIGEKLTLHLTECEVNKPAKCVITNETILIEKYKATTGGQGDNVQFFPEAGDITFTFEKCEEALFNGKHEVSGFVRGQPSGATIKFVHQVGTGETTLNLDGKIAGLEGKVTVSQAESTPTKPGDQLGKTGNPLSATTNLG